LEVGEKQIENAAWSYASPYDEVAAIKNDVAFYREKMDSWLEEAI
jgi:uncharacterized protein (DUF427 family)